MPITTQRPETDRVVSVGQLRLKRTLIAEPSIVRLYLPQDLYFKLNAIALYSQQTVDELLRNVAKDYVTECNQ
jgi:hypothetical protein